MDDVLGKVGGLVVAEPTSNEVFVGHKGALWLELSAKGIAAHGSMPEKGVSAIYHLVDAIVKLRDFEFDCPTHEFLGAPTLNVGTITGGTKINVVPDSAVAQVDIRKNPKMLDRHPSKTALEGSEPVPGHWPSINGRTSDTDKKIYPGEGRIFNDTRN